MTVEVPQIQFLDGGMVDFFFLAWSWLDSGYMVHVSSWMLLDGSCSPCTWKLDAPL